MRERFLREQSGFTLPEMLVTMMMMIVVLFALYSIFDMSIRVFKFGNDKVEAVENARLGLEKMEREIRAAYPVKGPTGNPRYRFFSADGSITSPPAAMPTAAQITFGNELNNSTQPKGNGIIDCNPSGAAVGDPGYTPCEYITYKLTDDASGAVCTAAPCTLRRVNAANSSVAGAPVVEFVRPPDTTAPIDPDQYGLRFKYLTASGTVATTQADIARVEMALQIVKDDGTQTLTTEVDLRNTGAT